jgi:hypothetical protein
MDQNGTKPAHIQDPLTKSYGALRIIAENKLKKPGLKVCLTTSEGMANHLNSIQSNLPMKINSIGQPHMKTNHFLPVWLEDRKQLQQEINNPA